jgi:hypothetical protein
LIQVNDRHRRDTPSTGLRLERHLLGGQTGRYFDAPRPHISAMAGASMAMIVNGVWKG